MKRAAFSFASARSGLAFSGNSATLRFLGAVPTTALSLSRFNVAQTTGSLLCRGFYHKDSKGHHKTAFLFLTVLTRGKEDRTNPRVFLGKYEPLFYSLPLPVKSNHARKHEPKRVGGHVTTPHCFSVFANRENNLSVFDRRSGKTVHELGRNPLEEVSLLFRHGKAFLVATSFWHSLLLWV